MLISSLTDYHSVFKHKNERKCSCDGVKNLFGQKRKVGRMKMTLHGVLFHDFEFFYVAMFCSLRNS